MNQFLEGEELAGMFEKMQAYVELGQQLSGKLEDFMIVIEDDELS
jgi:hypothetical protein